MNGKLESYGLRFILCTWDEKIRKEARLGHTCRTIRCSIRTKEMKVKMHGKTPDYPKNEGLFHELRSLMRQVFITGLLPYVWVFLEFLRMFMYFGIFIGAIVLFVIIAAFGSYLVLTVGACLAVLIGLCVVADRILKFMGRHGIISHTPGHYSLEWSSHALKKR
jgi:hypothetical protein